MAQTQQPYPFFEEILNKKRAKGGALTSLIASGRRQPLPKVWPRLNEDYMRQSMEDSIASANPNTPQPAPPTTPTLADIYAMQRTNVANVTTEQKRILAEAAGRKRESISQQIAQQRQAYAGQMANVNEQMFGAGQGMLQSLANRGLATSGLQQLGEVSLQAQKGKSMAQLADINRQSLQGIRDAGLQTESDLTSGLNAANLYQEGRLSDLAMSEYQTNQQEGAQRQQGLTNLITVLMSDPSMTPEQKQYYTELLTNPNITPEQYQDLVGRIETVTGGSTADKGLLGNAQTGLLRSVGGAYTGQLKTSTGLTFNISPYMTALGKVKDVSGLNTFMKSQYSGFEHYDKIQVDMAKPNGDLRTKPFKYGNKRFATWNKAVEYINSLATGE